ncbi:MAG TPA: histidinol-phosphate transaminase [Nitrospirota bacterium]|nr:histidinol-phosphate transaminase [Nitrospirota bacterium]
MAIKSSKTKDLTRLIRPEVRKLKAYFIDETSYRIKLDAMENPFSLPDDVKQEAIDAVKSAPFNRYPDPSAKRLKEAIAELWGIGTQRMVLGNGSDELIQAIILAFGGPIIIPVPTFALYEISAAVLAQHVVTIPLKKDFSLNTDKLLKKANDVKAKIIFLASPNNPTGNRFSDDAVLKILDKAKAAVVLDEAYFSFSNKTFLPMLKDYPNVIILRTLSKIGFAGLRIGVLTASPKIVGYLNKVRLPYNINILSQVAAEAALRRKDVLNRQISLLISARERLYNSLKQVDGVTAYPSETNFILIRTAIDASLIYEKLKESGILVKNLNRPGALANCLRVTVGTPDENNEFISSLRKILAAY